MVRFRIGKLLDKLRERGKRERIAEWKVWARKADKGGQGARLKTWVDPAENEFLVAVETAQGATLIRPAEVAQAFATEWGTLWQPDQGVEEIDRLCLDLSQTPAELPPITGADVEAALRAMPGRKASGLDSWTLQELRRLTPP